MTKLTWQERGSISTIAGIYALRMLGLFMIMPVFTLYARNTLGAAEYLIGMALGSYGLTQALLQIPCGILSDYLGRKSVIMLGLGLFVAGSVVAALAPNIYWIIAGRLLQGSGAIGSVLMTAVADSTREQVRTRAMAYLGATIGAAFMLAMILGPVVSQNLKLGVAGIFWLTAVLASLSIILAWVFVPNGNPNNDQVQMTIKPMGVQQLAISLKQLFMQALVAELMVLYLGAFILHAILAALFLVLPLLLHNFGLIAAKLWKFYSVCLVLAFVFSMIIIRIMERGGDDKQMLVRRWQVVSIFMLLLALASMLYLYSTNNVNSGMFELVIGMIVFFTGFCLLEASLPAQVTKRAPVAGRGTVLAIYSSSQFLGIFLGGVFGGVVQAAFDAKAVFVLCMLLALLWLWIVITWHGYKLKVNFANK